MNYPTRSIALAISLFGSLAALAQTSVPVPAPALPRATVAPIVAPTPPSAAGQSGSVANQDYRLGPGDSIGVQVYQSPDLSVDARVSESGVISYPLVGTVQLGGLTISEAEKKIADALRTGPTGQHCTEAGARKSGSCAWAGESSWQVPAGDLQHQGKRHAGGCGRSHRHG